MTVYAVVEWEGRYEKSPNKLMAIFATRDLAKKWKNAYLAKYGDGWRPTLRVHEYKVRTK